MADTNEMSMDSLKKAMSSFAAHHVESLHKRFPGAKSDEEVLALAVDQLATQDVLAHINANMTMVPVADLKLDGEDYIEHATDDERIVNGEEEFVDKLFDEPAFLVGEQMTDKGILRIWHSENICAFITKSGNWRFAKRKTMWDQYVGGPKHLSFSLYKETDDSYYGIESLTDLVPDEFTEQDPNTEPSMT